MKEGIPKSVTIKRVKNENKNVKTLFFDEAVSLGSPGQYLMVWIRGIDEIPISLSYKNAITVEKVGLATNALFNLDKGDSLGLRGPLGNKFKILEGSTVLLIGGGIGLAPLLYLADVLKENGTNITTLIGSRNKESLFFDDELKKVSKVFLSTDDGSFGTKGSVLDLLKNSIKDLDVYDMVYVCGPDRMIRALLDLFNKKNILEKTQFSVSRIIKCGLGICGSCSIDPKGLRVCRDGPVFYGTEIIDSEIGIYTRDHAGVRYKL
ncbi:MAG TPA: dihydroorotate dehydrogenase electron transfer subunit [Halobacteria archaeon]|nr:dihydroorotate dehydrogenase electron transfer subunit [Halobacteria archaeon]